MAKVRVCIIDDSLTMRAMLGQMLGGDRSLEVVGVVADAAEAYAYIRTTRPDVVTIDIALSGLAGLGLIERVLRERGIPVIVLSVDPDNCVLVDEALERGAVAVFDKREVVADTAGLVRLVKRAAALKPLGRNRVFA